MNKAELVSHAAAVTSSAKAAAGRMAGAVFPTIADAPSWDDPEAIARFGKFTVRGRGALQGRNPRHREPVAVPTSSERD